MPPAPIAQKLNQALRLRTSRTIEDMQKAAQRMSGEVVDLDVYRWEMEHGG